MEIKIYAQLVRDAFDDDDALTDYFVDNKDKLFVSVDSLIPILEEHYANIRKRRKDCAGLQILQYPISDLIQELRK